MELLICPVSRVNSYSKMVLFCYESPFDLESFLLPHASLYYYRIWYRKILCVECWGGEGFSSFWVLFFVVVIVVVVVFYEQQSKTWEPAEILRVPVSDHLARWIFRHSFLSWPLCSFFLLLLFLYLVCKRCKVLRSTSFFSFFLTTTRKDMMLFLQTLISRCWPSLYITLLAYLETNELSLELNKWVLYTSGPQSFWHRDGWIFPQFMGGGGFSFIRLPITHL